MTNSARAGLAVGGSGRIHEKQAASPLGTGLSLWQLRSRSAASELPQRFGTIERLSKFELRDAIEIRVRYRSLCLEVSLNRMQRLGSEDLGPCHRASGWGPALAYCG